jgi:hypothetical protein
VQNEVRSLDYLVKDIYIVAIVVTKGDVVRVGLGVFPLFAIFFPALV